MEKALNIVYLEKEGLNEPFSADPTTICIDAKEAPYRPKHEFSNSLHTFFMSRLIEIL
jgi:hypothetical protein